VNHRVAQGDERVDGAQRKTVDELFGEDFHGVTTLNLRINASAAAGRCPAAVGCGPLGAGRRGQAPPPSEPAVIVVAGVDDVAVRVDDVRPVDGGIPVTRRLDGDRDGNAVDVQHVADVVVQHRGISGAGGFDGRIDDVQRVR